MTDASVKTMEEFARLVGLSRPTVSRFFADPSAVRPRTRQTIEAGLARFNYSPNFFASSLTRGHAKAIGIVVPSIVDAFYAELVSAIELRAEARGYLTVLQCSHNDPQVERRAISRLVAMDVSAIALAPLGFTSDVETIERTKERVPMLFMDSRLNTGTPYVGTNNRQSVAIMVDYLCRTGAPPALFTMPEVNANVVERREAYRLRMLELGYEPRVLNPEPEPIGDDYERYGYQCFLRLAPEKMVGVKSIICPNDRVAFGLLAAARRLGLKVGSGPDDNLRVGSHDGQPFGEFAWPSLTTAAQNTSAIADLVARTLTGLTTGETLPAKDVLFDATIIFRNSA
ncbi:MAG: LacI family DNA-binding transcriptional regulator [Devosia sp.]